MKTKSLRGNILLDIQWSPRLPGEKAVSWVNSRPIVAGTRMRSSVIRVLGLVIFLDRKDKDIGVQIGKTATSRGHPSGD